MKKIGTRSKQNTQQPQESAAAAKRMCMRNTSSINVDSKFISLLQNGFIAKLSIDQSMQESFQEAIKIAETFFSLPVKLKESCSNYNNVSVCKDILDIGSFDKMTDICRSILGQLSMSYPLEGEGVESLTEVITAGRGGAEQETNGGVVVARNQQQESLDKLSVFR